MADIEQLNYDVMRCDAIFTSRYKLSFIDLCTLQSGINGPIENDLLSQ